MNVFRNIIGVILGIIIGSIVNMWFINNSGTFIPYPEGYDPSSMETMKETFHLLESKHFIMPFVAHAMGTFVGALVAGFVAASKKVKIALIIGGFFFFYSHPPVSFLPEWDLEDFSLPGISCWIAGRKPLS